MVTSPSPSGLNRSGFEMAATDRPSLSPSSAVTAKRSPTPSPWSSAKRSVTTAPPDPSSARDSSEPSAQSDPKTWAICAWSTPSTATSVPNARPRSWTMPVATSTPGTSATARVASGAIGDQSSWPTST